MHIPQERQDKMYVIPYECKEVKKPGLRVDGTKSSWHRTGLGVDLRAPRVGFNAFARDSELTAIMNGDLVPAIEFWLIEINRSPIGCQFVLSVARKVRELLTLSSEVDDAVDSKREKALVNRVKRVPDSNAAPPPPDPSNERQPASLEKRTAVLARRGGPRESADPIWTSFRKRNTFIVTRPKNNRDSCSTRFTRFPRNLILRYSRGRRVVRSASQIPMNLFEDRGRKTR